MTGFERLKTSFDVNWTTVLVGWTGLGVLSPWPDRWLEFPSLISPREVATYADEQLMTVQNAVKLEAIIRLLDLNLEQEHREAIKGQLAVLSDLDGRDKEWELRKWRAVLLEELLEHIPQDPLCGLLAFSEFWQNFGFPSDSPHQVQGRDNTKDATVYYEDDNFRRTFAEHQRWLAAETAALTDRCIKKFKQWE